MQPAPKPANEHERLKELLALELLDTPPEPAFDDLAKLASHLCHAPMALITLIDAERQWFKARVGIGVSETPREVSLCAHTVATLKPLVVRDAAMDPRFAENPYVTGEPHIRFYAGIPLVLEGDRAVGTLSVADHVPRELTPSQFEALSLLARQVERELELRKKLEGRAEPARAAALREGDLMVGRYRIDRMIGRGGMGLVAAATDVPTGARVAIKFLLPDVVARRDARERFVREARALASVSTPHVGRILDAGNLGNGAPFIVMEYLEGQDVRTRLVEAGKLSVGEAAEIVRQACDGLEVVHHAGILHRDLKPSNLFLARQPDGRRSVKLIDFGTVQLGVGQGIDVALTQLTRANVLVGTPSYMSPEQLGGTKELDARSDLWSLGAVLYELLTGAVPYEATSVTTLYAQMLSDPAPRPRDRAPDVPAGLSEIVARCLSVESALRYGAAAELADALAPYADAHALD